MKAAVLIPARMAAIRFPGKPLAKILGKPMIQWVYERSARAGANRVVVATDSDEIMDAVRAFGGEAIRTRDDHPNGTQRIAEAVADLDEDIIVNVQGDEPTIQPDAIRRVIHCFSGEAPEMATLARVIDDPEDRFNPNVVKVVCDRKGNALYFSRAPIPYAKHPGMHGSTWPDSVSSPQLQHIGIYGYHREFLLEYARETPSQIEQVEGLEQLRALWMGARIRVEIVDMVSIGVDTPADVARVERILRGEGI
jgi:3-deoxy-manno-octulosonate cytidylyltransferase (CMP-KDO synthetase)